MDTNKLKKKVLAFIIGIGTLVGIVSAANYDSPKELFDEQLKQDKETAIEEKLDVEKENASAKAKVPTIIKSLILLPFWLIGSVILNLLDKVVKLVGAPLFAFLLSVLFLFIILLIIVVSFIKFLYPNLTLKQILTKKLIVSVFICSFIITVSDKLLVYLYEGYKNIRKLIIFVLGLIVLVCLTMNIIKKKIKDEKQIKGIYVVE